MIGEITESEVLMRTEYREVGHVEALYRYPVKSMRGESIEETHVGWHGLAGDRRWAFTRTGSDSGLPWVSGRECPEILGYSARLTDAGDESSIEVTSPSGRKYAINDPELCDEIQTVCGRTISPFHLWRGTFDSMPISLITTDSIKSIRALPEGAESAERFRPNMLVSATDAKPYVEERWIGELLVFGEREDAARIRVARKDVRCSIVNIDTRTLHNDPAILREIVAARKNKLGVYGIVERPGTIRVNDAVRVAMK
jgi:uncharacterized protein YcbX